MIFEEATHEAFTYYPSALKPHSNKLVISACECCGEIRVVPKNLHRFLCGSCSCIFSCQNKGKNNPNYGKHCTEDQKAAISAANKGEKNYNYGKQYTEEEKAKLSIALKGRIFTAEHKRKISISHKGIKHTEATKVLIGTKSKGRKHTDATKAIMSAKTKGKKHPNYGKRGPESSNYKGGKKVSNAKSFAKRKKLGYILIYPVEEGEHGHHFTNEYVGGIPADVHQKLSGGSRKKHRTLVLQWLKFNDKKKYIKVLCVLAKQ